MVALTVAGPAGWRASDLELRTPPPSYTSSTLKQFHARGYAAAELFFVIGADAFAEIESWKDYPALLGYGALRGRLAARAPGAVAAGAVAAPRARMMTNPAVGPETFDTPSIILIDAPTADVSSTAIRELRGQGGRSPAWCTPGVQQHIEQHGLYTSRHPGTTRGGRSSRTRRQAGCMAKAEKRRKTPRLPRQIERAIRAAEDKKAVDLVVLDLRKAAGFTDYFVICSGTNPRQVRAIADGVIEALAAEGVEAGARRRLRPIGMDPARLLRLHRPHLRARDAAVLRPRAPVGQRRTDRDRPLTSGRNAAREH